MADDPTKHDRDPGLDGLRALAAAAVVVIHVSATAMQRLSPGTLDWWLADLYHAATVWAVPVFVLISGGLILDPARTFATREFLARRAGRILAPIVFWSLIYIAVRLVRGQTYLVQVIIDLFFGVPYSHLWYLFMAAGLYLVTPPLRVITGKADDAQLRYAAGIGLAIGMAGNLTGYFVGLPSPLAVLLFVPFVGYYLLGHGARAGRVGRPLDPRLALAIVVCASLITAAITGIARQGFPSFTGWKFMADPLSPTVIAAALAIYLTAPAIAAGQGPATFLRRSGAWVAPYALGVYVVHPLVMLALEEWAGLTAEGMGPALGVPVVAAAVFVLSLAGSRLIALVPGLRLVIGLRGRG